MEWLATPTRTGARLLLIRVPVNVPGFTKIIDKASSSSPLIMDKEINC